VFIAHARTWTSNRPKTLSGQILYARVSSIRKTKVIQSKAMGNYSPVTVTGEDWCVEPSFCSPTGFLEQIKTGKMFKTRKYIIY
jgi:hypothetical protein